MIVTFPRMGALPVALQALLTALDVRVLLPPPTGKTTLELGARYAPETACLPFKTTLGNFIQALEAGADTILTCGGEGPCRLGYYAAVQEDILRDLGYRFDMLVVEPDAGSVWRALRRLAAGAGWRRTWSAFRLAGAVLRTLDAVERAACSARPLVDADDEGQVETFRRQAVAAVAAATGPAEVAAAAAEFRRRLASLAAGGKPMPLKVGLVGEIYVMLESYVNNDIVRRLGQMGVAAHPTMLLGDYVATHIIKTRSARCRDEAVRSLASPYLGHYVGGHAVKSVGQTVALGQGGFDGIVHLFPFACMPEVIAANILPGVSETAGIPVLSLAFDEQTGTAGMVTRLEAFVDLLRYREKITAKCDRHHSALSHPRI